MQRILGQDRAINLLQAALRSGRVHHAWIFAGPAGVGKFTTAVEFARILLDPAAQPTLSGAIEADPDSRTSQLIDAGSHPDLHIIRKELALYSSDPQVRNRKQMNIPIDVLREWMIGGMDESPQAQAPVYRTPAHGHGKVFIIDEAELLDQHSQNALLKTLEEPPRETYLVLVTSRPDRLFPTIRSRCQIVRFTRLDAESMAAWFKGSNLNIDNAGREWIEQFADGSPGTAQLAAEYGFHQWWRTLAPMLKQLSQGMYPPAMGEQIAACIEEFATAWVKNHANASKDAANKAGARHLLSMLTHHVRARFRHAAFNGEDAERWQEIIRLIRDAERELYANVNMKLLLENLVVQWARCTSHVAA